jgi:formate hydrogenlyase subunit 3/multisubunit Na+/H+ antiporter MnhD subunit
VFVQDFLPVRGLAVLLLLLAKLMVDTARWEDTEWRLVIVVLAYIWVIAGMWFTISPWRVRDMLYWATANEKRVRVGSAMRLALALFIVVLGLTAYRKAEQRLATEARGTAEVGHYSRLGFLCVYCPTAIANFRYGTSLNASRLML